jgi:hypothetical protein
LIEVEVIYVVVFASVQTIPFIGFALPKNLCADIKHVYFCWNDCTSTSGMIDIAYPGCSSESEIHGYRPVF